MEENTIILDSARESEKNGPDVANMQQDERVEQAMNECQLEMYDLAKAMLFGMTALQQKQWSQMSTVASSGNAEQTQLQIQDSMNREYEELNAQLRMKSQVVEQAILTKWNVNTETQLQQINASPKLAQKTMTISKWIKNASEMKEPVFEEIEQQLPHQLTNELFLQVVQRFQQKVNARVLLEISCFKQQDPVELGKDFEEIFRMIVTKINLALKAWQRQLWVAVLKEQGISVSEADKRTLTILQKDIEQQFLRKQPASKEEVMAQLKLHSKVMNDFKTDYKLPMQEFFGKQGVPYELFGAMQEYCTDIDWATAGPVQANGILFELARVQAVHFKLARAEGGWAGECVLNGHKQRVTLEKRVKEESVYDTEIKFETKDAFLIKGIMTEGRLSGMYEKAELQEEQVFLTFGTDARQDMVGGRAVDICI